MKKAWSYASTPPYVSMAEKISPLLVPGTDASGPGPVNDCLLFNDACWTVCSMLNPTAEGSAATVRCEAVQQGPADVNVPTVWEQSISDKEGPTFT
jgi:hypothetical protein